MEVQARTEDRALLEKLVTVAERACIVANTLRGGCGPRGPGGLTRAQPWAKIPSGPLALRWGVV